MVISACTPYFKNLIQQADEKTTKVLFQTACKILAPQLHCVDAVSFCKEMGVTDEYLPLFYTYAQQH